VASTPRSTARQSHCGKLQLDLYAAVQTSSLTAWSGSCATSISRRAWPDRRALSLSIAAVEAGSIAPHGRGRHRRTAREAELKAAGVPDALARRSQACRRSPPLPTSVVVADRTGQNIAEVAATYSRQRDLLSLDRIARAARAIKVSDYSIASHSTARSTRSAMPSDGSAAAMSGNGATGARRGRSLGRRRKTVVGRIRTSVHEIASSGLTLSKLSWRRACWATWSGTERR